LITNKINLQIQVLLLKAVILQTKPSGCSIVSPQARRKVGTTQGTILPNGKASPLARTASATENNRPASGGIRVKTWGKSLRGRLVTVCWGKPYGLQGQIFRHTRLALGETR